MTANTHPTSNELLAALRQPDQATSTLEHLDECLACRVRLSRVREVEGLPPPDADSLRRIVQACTPLPDTLIDVVSSGYDETPRSNDIWRIGRYEALLVWVRKVFDDGIADVIPLVLDVELADQESVIVGADETPLATETAAMVALRTHVHVGSFINRVGSLDIRGAVAEVMAAVREGRRASGVRVGLPIEDDDDQRFEYRQALRDLLSELSPSAWAEPDEAPESTTDTTVREPTTSQSSDGIDAIKGRLDERVSGLAFQDVERRRVKVNDTVDMTSAVTITCLNTTVLVVTLEGDDVNEFPETNALVAMCEELRQHVPIADAVAVTIPGADWPTLLFTTADMRQAIQLPGGAFEEPTATVAGHGLVDTLCKHFEGVVTPWEVTESVSDRLGGSDLHEIAARHARSSIERITTAGRRAQQPAKKAGWQSVPAKFDEQVASFVVAIVNEEPTDVALAQLGLETRDD